MSREQVQYSATPEEKARLVELAGRLRNYQAQVLRDAVEFYDLLVLAEEMGCELHLVRPSGDAVRISLKRPREFKTWRQWCTSTRSESTSPAPEPGPDPSSYVPASSSSPSQD